MNQTRLDSQKPTHASAEQISAQDYRSIQQFLSQSCGIVLGENKSYLVKNRLQPVFMEFKLTSFSELVVALNSASMLHNNIKTAVVDAMTTNETFWFRDDIQFQELKDVIFPEIATRTGAIKIWSAACSSGQEPYTISMCVEDWTRQSGKRTNVQITGTDISASVLKEAKTASYSEMALSRGLDSVSRQRFFIPEGKQFRLKPEIITRVRFQQFNLLKSFAGLGRFDVIFCRNVLIYFSEAVKKDILKRMAASLEPGGYLFLSSTESMPLGLPEFELIRGRRARYYQKK